MKVLERKDVSRLFDDLLKEGYKIYGPRRTTLGGDFFFRRVSSFEEVEFEGFLNTLHPPKAFFFPQEERFLRLSGLRIAKVSEEEKKVIFGIRPCDVEGLLILDRFFLRGYRDPWYEARRKDTVLVAFSCFHPIASCFCEEADGGPWSRRGFDLQIHSLGEFFLVESGSPFGDGIIAGFPNAEEIHLQPLEEERKKALSRFKERPQAEKKLHRFSFEKRSHLWKVLGSLCFHCGGCTYLCPTCSCHHIFDRKEDNESWRIREWDSCLLSGFHRMAGDNPKDMMEVRMHFHMECKLSEEINKDYGRIACTGCGRCLQTCIGDAQIESLILASEEEDEQQR